MYQRLYPFFYWTTNMQFWSTLENKPFSTWLQEKSCLKIKCKNQNKRVHCTLRLYGYTSSLKTLISGGNDGD
jgi:hypothetical protein